MAAVVRVKRRRDEPAPDSFVIVSKRQKLENGGESENVSNVFKFAGTITGKDNKVSQHVKDAIRKVKIEREKLGQHECSATDTRVKQQVRRNIDARYKITTTKRGTDFACLNSLPGDLIDAFDASETAQGTVGASRKYFCLYDVEQDDTSSVTVEPQNAIECNGFPLIREKVSSNTGPDPKNIISSADSAMSADSGFVYDLYYMNTDSKFDFKTLEDILAVEAYNEELVQAQYDSDEDQYAADDDDENAESNYRNDYPDEDPRYYDYRGASRFFNTDNEDYAAGGGYEDDEDYYDKDDDDDNEHLPKLIQRRLNIDSDDDEGD